MPIYQKKIILRRKTPEGDCNHEYFSLFAGDYKTIDDGYVLYWYLSSQKKRLGKALMQKRASRADSALMELSLKLNKRDLITQEALVSYKYQPRLEKRFNQFKSVHEAAPILFKNIERVEGIMFLFFVVLIVQGIIERKVRMSMKERAIKSLPVYPEYRKSFYPTTSKIFYNFDGISSYKILKNDKVIKEFKDKLSSIQMLLLELLDMNEEDFWGK